MPDGSRTEENNARETDGQNGMMLGQRTLIRPVSHPHRQTRLPCWGGQHTLIRPVSHHDTPKTSRLSGMQSIYHSEPRGSISRCGILHINMWLLSIYIIITQSLYCNYWVFILQFLSLYNIIYRQWYNKAAFQHHLSNIPELGREKGIEGCGGWENASVAGDGPRSLCAAP